MERIPTSKERAYYFTRIERADEFRAPPDAASGFGCLLWDAQGEAGTIDRGALVQHLLEAGCGTLACGGYECEVWHDTADELLAALNATTWRGAERYVMTTWHTDETPAQVVFYVTDAAAVEEPAFGVYLVLQIGGANDVTDALVGAISRYAGG